MIYIRIILFITSLIWTSPLFAYNFKCDANQINCLVDDKGFTAGDKVVFLDRENRVVAVGTVTKIRGPHREIEVIEVFNHIPRNARIKLISNSDYENLAERFTIHRRFSPKSLGITAALANLGVLGGFRGQEYNLFFSRRLQNGFSINARSAYAIVSGLATKKNWKITEEWATQIQGLGLVPGVSYEAFANNPISFKVELGLGAMLVSSSIEGGLSLKEARLEDKIRNGLNLVARVSGSALINLVDWHLELLLANGYIFHPHLNQLGGSHLTSLGVGIIKDL